LKSRIAFPKFHDRKSLYIGAFGGFLFAGSAIYTLATRWQIQSYTFNCIQILQASVGLGLAIHCLNVIKYYKAHRIIKIVKTETERIIYKDKEVVDGNKIRVWLDALYIAWKQKSFRIWLVVCTVGIIIGLSVGIGMTNLVLLVAIACLGWGMEVANTAIETLLDIVHPAYSPKVKVVKDAFATVPKFVFSAYVISWLILVSPSVVEWLL